MNTKNLQNEIVNNYNTLSKKAHIPFNKQENTLYIWGLTNNKGKSDCFISQSGHIVLKKAKKEQTGNFFKDIAVDIYNYITKKSKSEIKITDGHLIKVKKPLFNTWDKTLNKVNNILKDTIENYDDTRIVKKNKVGLLCFSKSAAKRLQEINTNLHKKK